MKLIDKKELNFGRNKFIGTITSNLLMRILGINKINKLYDSLSAYQGNEFTANFLKKYNITYSADPERMAKIPAQGGVIVISNHPSGALDGILLIDAISRVRPDVKFMGNYLLSRIEPLKSYFIEVDPFDSRSAKNINGIRKSLEHLNNGGVLVIFPAGEVSTYQKGFTQLRDKEWIDSSLKFIRNSRLPVVPLYIEGKNSRLFHLVGMIHPLLRTAMLPHELLNKKNTNITLSVGAPLLPLKLSNLTPEQYGKYLRTNVDLLKEFPRRKGEKKETDPVKTEEIVSPVDSTLLKQEVDNLKKEHLLFDHNGYSVLCAPSGQMPGVMTEIGRLRELTFRQIGEGTNRKIDTDRYDEYYNQMFIWDNKTSQVIGAYRMGMGEEIMEHHGLGGFYTDSLFKMSPLMGPVMSRTIELGRSFIVPEYQRKTILLMLLWKGILYVLLKNEHYRYLMGPVTISGEYRNISKLLIVNYIKKHYYSYELAKNIKPVTGLNGLNRYIDPRYIDRIPSLEALDKIIADLEPEGSSVPVLFKRYLSLNSKVLGFNVDHDFNDALDALMLLDLTQVPESAILMLSKEFGIEAISRFKK